MPPQTNPLPPLPKPGHRGPDGTGAYFDSFTAAQMRERDAMWQQRLEQAVREALAQQAPVQLTEEFRDGQWWVAELDKVWNTSADDKITVTHDLKRAVAVVHNLLQQLAAQPRQSAVELAWECKRLRDKAVRNAEGNRAAWIAQHDNAIDRLASLAQPAPAGDERAAFEAWVSAERPSLLKHATIYPDMVYLVAESIAWDAWQARASHPTAQAAVAVPQWQPIETAPKDGTRIVAWIEWFDGPCTVIGAFRGDDFWPDERRTSSKLPTHWMPLAAAPQPTKEGE